MMKKLKQTSSFKIKFKPEFCKMEKYVGELSIAQNFPIKPGKTPHDKIQFPVLKKFQSGTLSEIPLTETFSGYFSRTSCQLSITKLLIPEKIGNKILTIGPFLIEVLANNEIIGEIKTEFVKANPQSSIHNYCGVVGLTHIWKDNVDLIRITLNIRVQESASEFVQIDLYDKVEELDQFVALKNEMTSFHNSEDLSDAVLCCGTEVIPVHRFVLALGSPVFRNMFKTEMKEKKNGEVVIEDIDAKILRLMIKWMYTRKLEFVELQDLMDLFKAAHKYQVGLLKILCISEICENISPKNALKMYHLGESYQEVKIQKKALQVIKSNKAKVFGDDEEHSEEFVLRYPKLALELIKG